MKAGPFRLATPRTVGDAVECLTDLGDDARLLAGGQSLLPLMAMRRQSPSVLVDLGHIGELSGISTADDHLAIGAMTRQRAVERSPAVAANVRLLALAVPLIAHVTVRNQGTVGGSVAHADPAAELPSVAVATGATMHVLGPNGPRVIAATEFFVGPHATSMAGDELLIGVRFPLDPPRSGWAFEEISRRRGDVAIVSVAAMLRLDAEGSIADARIVLGSVAPSPLRAVAAESLLNGHPPSADLFAAAAVAAVADIVPPSDLNGTGAYRRHIAAVLVRRALAAADARIGR